MIDPKHEVSITRQAELLGLSRAAVLRAATGVGSRSGANAPHRRVTPGIPLCGGPDTRDLLRPEGFEAGGKHIGTLMARMGIEALVRRKIDQSPRAGT